MPEEKQADSTPKRDAKGHFLPGVSGNPAGKPIGTLSLTAILKRKLSEELDEHGVTAGERLVAVTIEDALAGDSQSRKLCWEYIEGKARQPIDATIAPVPIIDDIPDDEPDAPEDGD
jgi:hypothetical protein